MVLCQDPGAWVPIPIPRAQVTYAIWMASRIFLLLHLLALDMGLPFTFPYLCYCAVTDRLPRLLVAHLYNPIPWVPVYSIPACIQLLTL